MSCGVSLPGSLGWKVDQSYTHLPHCSASVFCVLQKPLARLQRGPATQPLTYHLSQWQTGLSVSFPTSIWLYSIRGGTWVWPLFPPGIFWTWLVHISFIKIKKGEIKNRDCPRLLSPWMYAVVCCLLAAKSVVLGQEALAAMFTEAVFNGPHVFLIISRISQCSTVIISNMAHLISSRRHHGWDGGSYGFRLRFLLLPITLSENKLG